MLQSPGMLAYLRVPLGWKDLFKRSVKEAWADNVLDLAAQQAYYFFFALFPALLFVMAVASFFPLQSLIDDVVPMFARIAPADVVKIITDSMKSLSEQNSGGILTFAFFVTIWSSSGAMVSIITTLNTAYDVTESRPWWKTRLTAIGLTIGIAVFILASMFLVIAGPTLAENIADAHAARAGLQVDVVGAAVAGRVRARRDRDRARLLLRARRRAGLGLDHAGLDPRDRPVARRVARAEVLLPDDAGRQRRPTARSAAVMVLMLWFYVSGLALLLGAELNAEIEHASPYGKAPGERVPGEKRVVGPRAQRLYEEKKAKGEVPISRSRKASTATSIGRRRASTRAPSRAT